jgi:hypothetical protein
VSKQQALLGVGAVLAGLAAAWLSANHPGFQPYQTAPAGLALLVGWSFIASGLAARRARPDNPLGKVMVFTGFAWFASFLTDAHPAWLFTLGTVVQVVYLVGLVYLIISFPSGRLQGKLDGVLIAAAIALATVVELVLLLVASRSGICGGCPANVLGVGHDEGLSQGIAQAQRVGGVAVALILLATVVRRWSRASA